MKIKYKKFLKKCILHLLVFCMVTGCLVGYVAPETEAEAALPVENRGTCPKKGFDLIKGSEDPSLSRNYGTDISGFNASNTGVYKQITLFLSPDSPLLDMFGGSMPELLVDYDITSYMNNSSWLSKNGGAGKVYVPCYEGTTYENGPQINGGYPTDENVVYGSYPNAGVQCSVCGAYPYFGVTHEYKYEFNGQEMTGWVSFAVPASVFVIPDAAESGYVYNMEIYRSSSAPYTWSIRASTPKSIRQKIADAIYEYNDRLDYQGAEGPRMSFKTFTESEMANASHVYCSVHTCSTANCEERLHTHAIRYDNSKKHTATCNGSAEQVYYTGNMNSTYYEWCAKCGTKLTTNVYTGQHQVQVGPDDYEAIGEYNTTTHANLASHTYTWYDQAADSCYNLGNVHAGTLKSVYRKDGEVKYWEYTCQTCGAIVHYYNQYSGKSYYNNNGNGVLNMPLVYAKYIRLNGTSESSQLSADLWANTLHRTLSGRICGMVEYGGTKICSQVVTKLIAAKSEQILEVGDTLDVTGYVKYLNGHYKKVTCNYSGYNPSKYNEWQTVTLSYGTYSSTSSKTPQTTTIRVYVERSDADLTLKVDPAGAGTVSGAGTYSVGASVTAGTSGNPGYTFDGWYEGSTKKSSNTSYSFSMPGENLTLTAKYTAKTYTISAVSESSEMGTTTYPTSAKYNSSVTIKATPKSGYVFEGWYDGVKLVSSSASYTFTMPCYNVKYTARFTPPSYTVSFNSNGGTSCASIQVQYLGTYGALPIPTKNGYTFQGWKYNGNYITPLTTVSVKANHVLTAEWEVAGPEFILIDYMNKYGKNSWSLDSANVGQLGLTTARLGAWLPQPVKRGYTFTGWYRTENTQGNGHSLGNSANIVDKDTVMNLTGRHTLHAGWTPKSFTLSFDSNGGSSCSDMIITYDRRYGYHSRLPMPTKSGYVFAGWYTTETDNNGYGTQIENDTRVQAVGDQTLYAKWTQDAINITVKFDARTKEQAGLTAAESEELGFGSTIGTLSGISVFKLTYPGTYGNYPTTWCRCEESNHSAANGWKEFGNQHYYVDTTKTPTYSFPTPTRVGYTFDNYWETDSGTKVDSLADAVVISQNHTLYAHYTAKKYTVTLDDRGATSTNHTASVTMTYDAHCPDITVPAKTGYTFEGYFTGKKGTGTQYYDADGKSMKTWTETNVSVLYASWIQKEVELPEEDDYIEPDVDEEKTLEGSLGRTDAKGLLYADDYDATTDALTDLQPYLTYDTPASVGVIPGTETLSFRAKMGSWMLNYKFHKNTGKDYVKIVVTVPYRTQYEVGNTEELVISDLQTKDYDFLVPKTWSYWEILESAMYYPDSVTVENELFDGGSFTVSVDRTGSDAVVTPDYEAESYGGKSEHVKWPDYEADQTPVLTLELAEEQYIISTKPDTLPNVDAHNRIIAKNAAWKDDREAEVRSDFYEFGGNTLLSDEWLEQHGASLDEANVPTNSDLIDTTSYLQTYLSGVNMDECKPNGLYESTAEITYVGDTSNVGGDAEKTVALSDINDLNIHTPVACDGTVTEGMELTKDENGNELHVLTLKEALNFFTLRVDNTGTHLMSLGYGYKDFKEALSGKYNVATENGSLLNQVQFPFDVFVDMGSDSLKADGSYDTTGDYYIKSGTWLTISDQEAMFYVPISLKDDTYTINFRSIAVNCPKSDGEYVITDNEELNVNLSPEHYVALDKMLVDVRLTAEDFDIINTNDDSALEMLKRGEQNLVLKKGYKFAYKLTTLGGYYGDAAEVKIVPKYAYISEDGYRVDANFYYSETINGKKQAFILSGSERDNENYHTVRNNSAFLGISADLLAKTKELSGVNDFIGMSSKMYTFGNIRLNKYFRMFAGLDTESLPTRFCSTCHEVYTDSADVVCGHAVEATGIKSLAPKLVQEWYGEFFVPRDSHVVREDTMQGYCNVCGRIEYVTGGKTTCEYGHALSDLEQFSLDEYAKYNTISGEEPFFQRKGYLNVSFDIQIKSDEGNWITFDVWEQTELYGDFAGQNLYQKGDVIWYDLSASSADDYEVGGAE